MNIKKSITIDAPIRTVFDRVADTPNLVDFIPSMMEIRNVKGTGKGRTYDWTFKLVGIPFKGTSEVVNYDVNKRIMTRSSGALESTWDWKFTAKDDRHTNLELEIEYTAPGKVLAKLTEPLLKKQNLKEAELSLENLKHMVESRLMTPA